MNKDTKIKMLTEFVNYLQDNNLISSDTLELIAADFVDRFDESRKKSDLWPLNDERN